MEEYKRLYRGHLGEFWATFFRPETLLARMEAMQRLLRQSGEVSRAIGKANSPTTMPGGLWIPVTDLTTFIARRCEAVRGQIDGGKTGYIPSLVGNDNFIKRMVDQQGRALAEATVPSIFRAVHSSGDQLLPDQAIAGAKAFFARVERQGKVDEESLVIALAEIAPLPVTPIREPGPALIWAHAIMRAVDADHDGKLALGECTRYTLRAFRNADKNGDAALSRRELVDGLVKLLSGS